jgi:DNA-binding SARP family transcriptional activator
MPHFTVRMFGKFSVLLDEKPVNGLDACKLQELLSYLLVYHRTTHARETLATLLWGESSTAQSKKYLRQALWQIQSALDSRDQPERIFHVEPDWISIDKRADVWVDVAVFEQAFTRAREVPGQDLDPRVAQSLEDAVQLYQGDFLAGWYQDWCVCERERLQTNYLIMLDKLMSYCEVLQKYETGLTYGLTVLRYDRARESTHRRLMRLHYLAGDRTGALRQYEHCVTALQEELGVKPSRHTIAVYEQMRLDEFQAATSIPDRQRLDDPSVVHTVINHLKRMRRSLKEIHGRVQEDIKAVDKALDDWR